MKKIVFLMMTMMIVFQSLAQWDGTSSPWTQGTGTESNPYLIESPQHLAYLADMVCSGMNDYNGKHFLLTHDISLSNQSWMPIGDNNHPFKGNFDGGGHTIDSMYINDNYTYAGLFGCIQGSNIGYFVLNGQYAAAGLTPCSGGAVGYCHGGGHLSSIVNNCNVKGSVCVGGIVSRYTSEDTTTTLTINNCVNNGSVWLSQLSTSSEIVYAGGIVGYIYGKFNITQSTNNGSGNISSVRATYLGGIVGGIYCRGISKLTICNNTASLSMTNNTTNYKFNAGIVGDVWNGNLFSLKYCYNTGDVTVNPINNSYGYAAGIGFHCQANYSYNVGTLNASNKFGTSDNVSTNSYYLNVCGATTGGSSRTAAQMKSSSFPIILNTDSIIFVMDENNENEGYPIFAYTTVYDVTTDSTISISSLGAILQGHYGGVADTVGFVYGLSSSATMNQIYSDVTTSPVSYTLSNLQPNTQYRYAFFVKHNGTYIYGDTLTFATKPLCNVTVASNNNMWGNVVGGGNYGYGENCTLTAMPTTTDYGGWVDTHYVFIQWSDGNTDNPRTITVTSDTTLQAVFGPRPYVITIEVNNTAWGSVTGAGVYEYYSPAILTAIPTEGYHLQLWREGTGSCTGELNPLVIEHVARNISIVAEFAPNQYTVTVLANDSTMGTVSGGGTYNYGQQVYIVAQPTGNYLFTQWSDGNTNPYRLINVTENVTYTAIFTDAIFNITAQSNNSSFGIVTGGGSYARGSQICLAAIANEGYHFTQWNDGNTDNPRMVTVNADATFTAQFAANTYVVNVNSSNTAMGSAMGGGIFSYGQQTTIEATPMPHYRFVEWDDGVNSNPRVVTITSDTIFTAMFEQMPQYTIIVSSADETKGSVSGGGIFYGGEQTVIRATAASGNVFDRWSDGNTEAIRTITVTSDAIYTAYFSGVRCTVNVYSNDDNMGTVSGGGEYEQGAQATVTATPVNGYRFVRWNNGVEQNPYTFTVYSDVNLIANFERTTNIGKTETEPYLILTNGTEVIVLDANNLPINIRDIIGRTIYSTSKYDGNRIELPSAGMYLVTIDNCKSYKIVLIK